MTSLFLHINEHKSKKKKTKVRFSFAEEVATNSLVSSRFDFTDSHSEVSSARHDSWLIILIKTVSQYRAFDKTPCNLLYFFSKSANTFMSTGFALAALTFFYRPSNALSEANFAFVIWITWAIVRLFVISVPSLDLITWCCPWKFSDLTLFSPSLFSLDEYAIELKNGWIWACKSLKAMTFFTDFYEFISLVTCLGVLIFFIWSSPALFLDTFFASLLLPSDIFFLKLPLPILKASSPV